MSAPFLSIGFLAITASAQLLTTPADCNSGGCFCTSLHSVPINTFENNQCFSQAELEQLGVSPANREGTEIKIEMHPWPSNIISSMITGIIAREALGYKVSYTCALNDVNAMARINNGYTDVLAEYQLDVFPADTNTYVEVAQTVEDSGFSGYMIQAGIYVPDVFTPMAFQNIYTAIGNPTLGQMVAESFQYWTVFNRPEVVAYYAAQNDTSIVSIPGLTMIGNFTPEWCNAWNPSGIGNNCIDIKSEDPNLDPGVVQQMIRNLKLNMTVSYWGTGLDGTPGFGTYLKAKLLKMESFVAKSGYIPENIYGSLAIKRVQFPPYSQACYAGNTQNSQGYGSVACDFPINKLHKISSPKVMTADLRDPRKDFGLFYRRMKISQADMDDLWGQDIPQTSSFNGAHLGIEYQIACGHLKNNTAVWASQWVSNSYVAPRYENWTFDAGAKNFLAAISAIGIFVALVVVALLLCYRSHDLIKALSMNFTIITVFGLLLVILSTQLYLLEKPGKTNCTARLWLPPLGFVIGLSALGAKTYRIYRIFTKTLENSQMVTDAALIKLLIFPVLLVVTLLAIQTAVAPPGPESIVVEDTSANVITTYDVCKFDTTFYFVIVSVLGAIVICITKLAYDSREAPLQFNEAKELGMSLYTAVISGFVGVPLIAWLESQQEFTAMYVTIGVIQCIPPVVMLLFLFAVRIFDAIRGISVEEMNEKASRRINLTASRSNAVPGNGQTRFKRTQMITKDSKLVESKMMIATASTARAGILSEKAKNLSPSNPAGLSKSKHMSPTDLGSASASGSAHIGIANTAL